MAKEYALYKGEELLHIGTVKEIAAAENVKVNTVQFYMTPTYRKRRKNGKNYRVLVKLDD